MRGLFVTGTDTGVGKTEVACALLRDARSRGIDAVGMKPAQSGASPAGTSDAERLAAAAGGVEPVAAICPYSFAAPLAPALAARFAGQTVSLERIVAAALSLAARRDALVVEGAGGLLVPLTESETYADLALALALPVVIVARAGLGTVNHTALTVEALLRRGLELRAIVLDRTSPVDDPSVAHNGAEIARLTGAVPVATLPFVRDIEARGDALRSMLAGKIQF